MYRTIAGDVEQNMDKYFQNCTVCNLLTCLPKYLYNCTITGSKEFQNSYSSACHFALVLQLDKEGKSTCPDQVFCSKDKRMYSLDSE